MRECWVDREGGKEGGNGGRNEGDEEGKKEKYIINKLR